MAFAFDEKFTKDALQSLKMAQEEALRLNHGYIGTEHLLLGLMRNEASAAASTLADLGLTLGQVRIAVARVVGRGEQHTTRLQLTDQTKDVMKMAIEEARNAGDEMVDTQHLLMALLRLDKSMASAVLESLNISTEVVRRRLGARMSQDSPADRTPALPERRSRGKKSEESVLEQLSVDLTAKAQNGELDPVIGRETEIERVIQILARRTKNNPALIGEPGVGKTAIVEGLAQRIIDGHVPSDLRRKRLVRLDVGSLVAGTMYRGQFEERLKKVIDEIESTETVLFIDELHMLVGAGSAGSSMDAANILKPALSRGELQCIGATTLDEYRKHIESDAALERRFQPVFVDEPTVEETLEILKGIRDRYEEHHKLTITDEALEAAARLAARFVPDRFLPDKAIDLVDEAASRVRVFRVTRQANGTVRRRSLTESGNPFADDVEFDLDADETQPTLFGEPLRLKTEQAEDLGLRVTPDDIAEIVAMWTGVPVSSIAEEESLRLLKMESALHKRVVGQEQAIESLARSVRRARAGLKDPRRPIGSFIFLGPTGVGKTELCKALAEFMFGTDEALVQLDMSEFMERHSVSRLVGAPPGYIGYDEAGQLTEAIRRRPYSVVCFDEIEKAHPEAFNMLLQIMEDGHLTDAKGRKVDFRNTIIIMTSNVGSEAIRREATLGFAAAAHAEGSEANYREMKARLMRELKRLFRPEFLNRVDETVVFHELTRDDIHAIVNIQVTQLNERLAEHGVSIELTDAAHEVLVQQGYDPQFGARPLRRAIQRLIEDPLAERLLAKEAPGRVVVVDAAEGEIVFRAPEGVDEPQALVSAD
ncbi:MAG: ATP-dependent Clp protease ATP-binding subunit [Anaerolineae bacterium]|jgi:ATP-dependent Clp protease ATP-binding subunit ClpC